MQALFVFALSFKSVKRFFPVFKRTSEFFRNHEVLEIMPKRANRVIDMGSPPRLPEISISFDEVLASPPESLDAYSTGDTDKSSVCSFENRPFDIQRWTGNDQVRECGLCMKWVIAGKNCSGCGGHFPSKCTSVIFYLTWITDMVQCTPIQKLGWFPRARGKVVWGTSMTCIDRPNHSFQRQINLFYALWYQIRIVGTFCIAYYNYRLLSLAWLHRLLCPSMFDYIQAHEDWVPVSTLTSEPLWANCNIES